jgi:hypothetical protein
MVASSSTGGGSDGGRSDAQDTRWSFDVADPGENLRFRPLVGAADGDVLCVLEGIIEGEALISVYYLWGKP